MKQPPSVLLAGAGAHGFNTYCRQVLPRLAGLGKIRLAGVVEPVAESRERARTELGLQPDQVWENGREALERAQAQIVIVATPYFAHEELCLAAAERGLALFIEKPVSDTLAGVWRIVEAVRRAGVKAAVNMSARFEEEKIRFGRLLRSGVIGRVDYVFCRMAWNHEANARYRADAPHPYLMEAGVHALDMLREYAGGRPERVFNLTWPTPGNVFEGNANAVVSMTMDNGARAVLEGSWTLRAVTHSWRNEYIRADGSEGSLLLDHRRIQILRGREESESGLAVREVWPEQVGLTSTDLLLERFVDWVEERCDQHPTDLEDNLQCMALLFAALASAERRTELSVPAYLEECREAES
ncbi:MAG: gfo/Idh/MocA family oxidoreductase [Puniceicoccaceae bacterium]|nr:MAG: gfo/Idh/MocA family oxidoreductase [Puniceicoccaceae bacterium]